MASKRKRYFRPSGSQKHRENPHQTSPPDPKRRRLSNDSRESDDEMRHTRNGHPDSHRRDKDDDGWTKVVSKSSKSKKDRGRDQDGYPQLKFYDNYHGTIRTSDLRDLALYLLADGVAPNWMGIANSRYVKKIVTVLVPGLDEKLLRRAEKLLKQGKESKLSAIAGPAGGDTTDQTAESSNEPASDVAPDMPEGIVTSTTAAPTHPSRSVADRYLWLFKNVLQVKAPGDAKANRVHSPLQAMLLAPESRAPKTSGPGHGGFQAMATPITDFVHTADELREAEFPVHPAAFTNKTDAELEAMRREKTGQSISAGWVDTAVSDSTVKTGGDSYDSITRGTSIYSVDCEMVQTSDGVNSLARVSLISYPDGKVIIDKYVKPDLPITNYFTQFSGITPEILANVTTTLQDVQKELLAILTPSSILLGHSLDSDMNALKLTHPFVVDTSLVYPHPRGLPLRSSLKFLANKYLKREIQIGGANGHNSVEDAQAVLDLIKMKCEKGPKWGTMEANGEAIFRRLKRNGRTSAMVEYGTPERGFGKDATYTIGCQDDDEVVKGIIRAIKGDNFFDFEIPAGGADFVWGRLRALEYARGWVSGAASTIQQTKKESEGTDGKDDATGDETVQNAKDDDKDEAEKLDDLACGTLARLQQIYDALPDKALLILASGTSDIRPVMRLQAQQQQYRKEFKVKKWDELTIKWTDTEEQALRKACEDARAGWGVCVVK